MKNSFELFICFCLIACASVFGQSPLPEQDCIHAIKICNNSYFQQNSYAGTGAVTNEINPLTSCLTAGERNDVWYTFAVQQSGTVNFLITPNNPSDDYDWAVFNITNSNCSGIGLDPSLEVSCNFSGNTGCGGITGPDGNIYGNCGLQHEPGIPVTAGEIYVINVSNFSASQSGYAIDFSTSTAVIYDNTAPAGSSASMGCTQDSFTVQFSENIDCSTLTNNPPTDFILKDAFGNSYLLKSVTGISIANNLADELKIITEYSVHTSGTLYLIAQIGIDGNTISDICGNFISAGDTVSKITVSNTATVNLGNDVSLCPESLKPVLNAGNTGANYKWYWNGNNIGSNSQTLQTNLAGNYSVVVNYGNGCAASDSMNLIFLPLPVVNLGNDTTICFNDAKPVLNADNSGSQFSWTLNGNQLSGHTMTLQTSQAGIYTVTVMGNTCSASDSLVLSIRSPLAVNAGEDKSICKGDSVLLFSGITNAVKYDWAFNGSFYSSMPSVNVSVPGSYSIIVADSNKCTGSDTIIINKVTAPEIPHVDCPVNKGNANEFHWNETKGAFGYEVSLDNGKTWQAPSLGNTALTEMTTLNISQILVRALSENNCEKSAPAQSEKCDVVVSNIMTPNGDGKNDTFFISDLQHFPQTSVTILNRYGSEVFHNSDYHNDWNAQGEENGTYFYIVTFQNGTSAKGTLTIIK